MKNCFESRKRKLVSKEKQFFDCFIRVNNLSFCVLHFRLCASSEQIGDETLGQMGRQREQLEATNQYLHDTSTLTGQARQILQDMYVLFCIKLVF